MSSFMGNNKQNNKASLFGTWKRRPDAVPSKAAAANDTSAAARPLFSGLSASLNSGLPPPLSTAFSDNSSDGCSAASEPLQHTQQQTPEKQLQQHQQLAGQAAAGGDAASDVSSSSASRLSSLRRKSSKGFKNLISLVTPKSGGGQSSSKVSKRTMSMSDFPTLLSPCAMQRLSPAPSAGHGGRSSASEYASEYCLSHQSSQHGSDDIGQGSDQVPVPPALSVNHSARTSESGSMSAAPAQRPAGPTSRRSSTGSEMSHPHIDLLQPQQQPYASSDVIGGMSSLAPPARAPSSSCGFATISEEEPRCAARSSGGSSGDETSMEAAAVQRLVVNSSPNAGGGAVVGFAGQDKAVADEPGGSTFAPLWDASSGDCVPDQLISELPGASTAAAAVIAPTAFAPVIADGKVGEGTDECKEEEEDGAVDEEAAQQLVVFDTTASVPPTATDSCCDQVDAEFYDAESTPPHSPDMASFRSAEPSVASLLPANALQASAEEVLDDGSAQATFPVDNVTSATATDIPPAAPVAAGGAGAGATAAGDRPMPQHLLGGAAASCDTPAVFPATATDLVVSLPAAVTPAASLPVVEETATASATAAAAAAAVTSVPLVVPPAVSGPSDMDIDDDNVPLPSVTSPVPEEAASMLQHTLQPAPGDSRPQDEPDDISPQPSTGGGVAAVAELLSAPSPCVSEGGALHSSLLIGQGCDAVTGGGGGDAALAAFIAASGAGDSHTALQHLPAGCDGAAAVPEVPAPSYEAAMLLPSVSDLVVHSNSIVLQEQESAVSLTVPPVVLDSIVDVASAAAPSTGAPTAAAMVAAVEFSPEMPAVALARRFEAMEVDAMDVDDPAEVAAEPAEIPAVQATFTSAEVPHPAIVLMDNAPQAASPQQLDDTRDVVAVAAAAAAELPPLLSPCGTQSVQNVEAVRKEAGEGAQPQSAAPAAAESCGAATAGTVCIAATSVAISPADVTLPTAAAALWAVAAAPNGPSPQQHLLVGTTGLPAPLESPQPPLTLAGTLLPAPKEADVLPSAQLSPPAKAVHMLPPPPSNSSVPGAQQPDPAHIVCPVVVATAVSPQYTASPVITVTAAVPHSVSPASAVAAAPGAHSPSTTVMAVEAAAPEVIQPPQEPATGVAQGIVPPQARVATPPPAIDLSPILPAAAIAAVASIAGGGCAAVDMQYIHGIFDLSADDTDGGGLSPGFFDEASDDGPPSAAASPAGAAPRNSSALRMMMSAKPGVAGGGGGAMGVRDSIQLFSTAGYSKAEALVPVADGRRPRRATAPGDGSGLGDGDAFGGTGGTPLAALRGVPLGTVGEEEASPGAAAVQAASTPSVAERAAAQLAAPSLKQAAAAAAALMSHQQAGGTAPRSRPGPPPRISAPGSLGRAPAPASILSHLTPPSAGSGALKRSPVPPLQPATGAAAVPLVGSATASATATQGAAACSLSPELLPRMSLLPCVTPGSLNAVSSSDPTFDLSVQLASAVAAGQLALATSEGTPFSMSGGAQLMGGLSPQVMSHLQLRGSAHPAAGQWAPVTPGDSSTSQRLSLGGGGDDDTMVFASGLLAQEAALFLQSMGAGAGVAAAPAHGDGAAGRTSSRAVSASPPGGTISYSIPPAAAMAPDLAALQIQMLTTHLVVAEERAAAAEAQVKDLRDNLAAMALCVSEAEDDSMERQAREHLEEELRAERQRTAEAKRDLQVSRGELAELHATFEQLLTKVEQEAEAGRRREVALQEAVRSAAEETARCRAACEVQLQELREAATQATNLAEAATAEVPALRAAAAKAEAALTAERSNVKELQAALGIKSLEADRYVRSATDAEGRLKATMETVIVAQTTVKKQESHINDLKQRLARAQAEHVANQAVVQAERDRAVAAEADALRLKAERKELETMCDFLLSQAEARDKAGGTTGAGPAR